MNQSNLPPDLPEGFLLAYSEGALSEFDRRRVEQLLAQDPELREELAALMALHTDLGQRLAQAPASAQELGEYLLGLLPPERASAVESRLALDARLQTEAAQLREYLASLDLPPAPAAVPGPGLLGRLGDRVNLIVAQLAQGLARPGLAPVPVRGEGPAGGSRPVTYQVGEGQLLLDIQPDPSNPAVHTLLGLLLNFEQPETLTARIYSGEREQASAPCDDLGNFTLAGLLLGSYDLVLSGATLEILVPAVAIA